MACNGKLRIPDVDANEHISADARIVEYVDFERGIVKVLLGNATSLTAAEKLFLQPFRLETNFDAAAIELATENLDDFLENADRQREEAQTTYINLFFIPATTVLKS